ncbi:MAG: hypothetical protein ABJA49_17925 [Betaproteobacteria bacterium]
MATERRSISLTRNGCAALLMAWACSVAAQSAPRPAASAPRPASSAPVRSSGPSMLIVSCDPGGCWDEFGTRYDRAGDGVFIRPDGHECRVERGRFHCK